MIEANEVCVRYGQSQVLSRLSLKLQAGDRVGIVGASGSGKSTLLRLAAGLQQPDSGTWKNSFGRTAIAFQQPTLLPWRTALDNLVIPLLACGLAPSLAQQQAYQWLERVGLKDSASCWPSQLSGGMAQRLGLARALSVKPNLLLLDEPFSALDPQLRQTLGELCRQWVVQSGAALLVVTHHPQELAPLVERRFMLVDGQTQWQDAFGDPLKPFPP
ncbi:ABC transporter ATP-binding protein [Pseudomonas moorei]|nr:ABC transporter ATP-binding protein [Pseudomonas moorei]